MRIKYFLLKINQIISAFKFSINLKILFKEEIIKEKE